MFFSIRSLTRTTARAITTFVLLYGNEQQHAVNSFSQPPIMRRNAGHGLSKLRSFTRTRYTSDLQLSTSATLTRTEETEELELDGSAETVVKGSELIKPKRKSTSKARVSPPKLSKKKSRLDSVIPASTLPGGIKPNQKFTTSISLLTREEEVEVSNAIRSLRTVVRVRDTLDDPTEQEWAAASNMSVPKLRHVMQSGQDARTKLVSANAGLVMSIAKRYHSALKRASSSDGGVGTILSLNDLIQEGNLGLMEAAERFEPSRGFRFSTYATWWVRQRVLQSITDYSRIIRLPSHVHSMLRKLKKEEEEMEEEMGRPPSIPELAHRLGVPAQKLKLYTDSSRSVLSLEVPVNVNKKDDRRTIGDKIASKSPTPDEMAELDSLRQEIWAVVEELSPRERDVLVSRFGLEDGAPRSVLETAQFLGISPERVRALETKAMNKLRHPQRNYRLKDFVVAEVESENSPSAPEKIWSF